MLSKKEQVKAMANIMCENCLNQTLCECMVIQRPCKIAIRHSKYLYKHNCRIIDKPKVVKRYNKYLGVDEWAVEREYVATKFCPFKTEEEAQAALKRIEKIEKG